MVNGSPELFFTISKSLRSHIFNHADNVQSIEPMGGWEMDERGWKFVDVRIVTGSRLLGGTLGTRVRVPAPLLMLDHFSNSHPLPKPLSQSAEVEAWRWWWSPEALLAPRVWVITNNQAPISALESAPQNQPPASLQQRPPINPAQEKAPPKWWLLWNLRNWVSWEVVFYFLSPVDNFCVCICASRWSFYYLLSVVSLEKII